MKILMMKSEIEKRRLVSINEEIIFNTLSYNGPEITLEDGSAIVFHSMSTYFDVITDPIFCKSKDEIDINEFEKKHLILTDDIVGKYKNKNLISVSNYGNGCYRLFF